MQKVVIAFVLSFFPVFVVADILLVEKDFKTLHFVYADAKKSGLFYYAIWIENANKCFDAKGKLKLAVVNKEKNFYQVSEVRGILCVYSTPKPLVDEFKPYQIMPDDKFLFNYDSKSPTPSPPQPLPPIRKKLKNLSLKCKFEASTLDKIKICELPLNW